jgi:hypothetical protein
MNLHDSSVIDSFPKAPLMPRGIVNWAFAECAFCDRSHGAVPVERGARRKRRRCNRLTAATAAPDWWLWGPRNARSADPLARGLRGCAHGRQAVSRAPRDGAGAALKAQLHGTVVGVGGDDFDLGLDLRLRLSDEHVVDDVEYGPHQILR